MTRLTKIALAIAVLTVIVCIPLFYYQVENVAWKAAKERTLEKASQAGNTIKNARHLYTSEVVDEAQHVAGMHITHDYRDTKYDSIGGAIPLPATFSLDLAEAMSDTNTSIKLFSKYPFPIRKGRELTEFESNAWDYFITDNTDEPFFQIDEEAGT